MYYIFIGDRLYNSSHLLLTFTLLFLYFIQPWSDEDVRPGLNHLTATSLLTNPFIDSQTAGKLQKNITCPQPGIIERVAF